MGLPWRLCQRVGACLCDLRVLGRLHAGHSDGADDLAVPHQENAAFERGDLWHTQHPESDSAGGERLFERLGRAAKVERGLRFRLGDLDAPVLCLLESMESHQVTGAVTMAMTIGQRFRRVSRSAASITTLAAANEIGEP
jgi:hypothetical protein